MLVHYRRRSLNEVCSCFQFGSSTNYLNIECNFNGYVEKTKIKYFYRTQPRCRETKSNKKTNSAYSLCFLYMALCSYTVRMYCKHSIHLPSHFSNPPPSSPTQQQKFSREKRSQDLKTSLPLPLHASHAWESAAATSITSGSSSAVGSKCPSVGACEHCDGGGGGGEEVEVEKAPPPPPKFLGRLLSSLLLLSCQQTQFDIKGDQKWRNGVVSYFLLQSSR